MRLVESWQGQILEYESGSGLGLQRRWYKLRFLGGRDVVWFDLDQNGEREARWGHFIEVVEAVDRLDRLRLRAGLERWLVELVVVYEDLETGKWHCKVVG